MVWIRTLAPAVLPAPSPVLLLGGAPSLTRSLNLSARERTKSRSSRRSRFTRPVSTVVPFARASSSPSGGLTVPRRTARGESASFSRLHSKHLKISSYKKKYLTRIFKKILVS